MPTKKTFPHLAAEDCARAFQDVLLRAAHVSNQHMRWNHGANPLDQINDGPYRRGQQNKVASLYRLQRIFCPGIQGAHLACTLKHVSTVAAHNPASIAGSLRSKT